ncbi:hypothetical protein HMI54_000434 [Coelomomyces lativittatus]|nr:hypothetical protein HMI55_002337 [Coelomomyces lativittatus]KAJ1511905.1 hypothetical protein HMI54_000434 [Coelomomyces lativittatus]KAJ1515269.1 hypothetical protein HMI56_006157 [Coelomomyces lativittatus]
MYRDTAALRLKENKDIITEVFWDLSEVLEDITQKAILCVTNAGMIHINEQLLQKLPGETVENKVTGFGVFP